MRIGICEDEKIHSDTLAAMIRGWQKQQEDAGFEHHVSLSVFQSANEFIMKAEGELYDLLFLDINMEGINGYELAERIFRSDSRTVLVFTTANPDYLAEGYYVRAFRYLLKPLKQQDVLACLEHVKALTEKEMKQFLIVKTEDGSVRVPYYEILYAEVRSHYIYIVTDKRTYRFKGRLADVEAQLTDGNFIKCHRSYLLNISHIDTMKKGAVVMANQQEISVSSRYYQTVREKYLEYYR